MELLDLKKLKIRINCLTLSLDNYSKDCDYSFLSHAHSDHLFKSGNEVLCTDPTHVISSLRGCSFDKADNVKRVKLLNSGHILGSSSLFLKDDKESLLFTGDFSTKDRGFITGFKPVKCDTLIMESTFGNPYFLFPDYKREMKRAKDFVDDNIRKGYLTVLMGYALGKSQDLQYYFKDYNKSVHDKILPYNDAYKSFGVRLGEDVLVKKADLLFTPLMNSNNNYFNELKRKRGLKFAVFSGWNVINSYKERFNADAGFTISDHADFLELLSVVKKTGAKTVYVHHGDTNSFAEFLKMEGVNAVSL